MIHAASREALATLRPRVEAVLHRFSTEDGLLGLADELYQVVSFLVGEPRVRRSLADPAAPAEARAEMVDGLLAGKVSTSALQIVQEAASLRWSSAWDLLDALETTADDTLFEAAAQRGVLDEVEDELFRFERVLSSEGELVGLFDDDSVPGERRRALLDSLLQGRVEPETLGLLAHAIETERTPTLTLAVDNLIEAAAARRNRSVARVVSAVELTSAQQERLRAVLSEMYGRDISVRTAIDPAVQGGLVVRVGDEVIDGSIATRLTQARAALAG